MPAHGSESVSVCLSYVLVSFWSLGGHTDLVSVTTKTVKLVRTLGVSLTSLAFVYLCYFVQEFKE